MRRLLVARPGLTAVFASSDQMALGAIRALDEAGLRAPRDVSVVGFDDEAFGEYCLPSLTTVSQPLFEIGRAAVEHVLARLGGDAPPLPSFHAPLRVRDSSGPVRVERAARVLSARR